MTRSDWDISGSGGCSIVDFEGSMRCQLSGPKLLLYNGNVFLTDCEVVFGFRTGQGWHTSSSGVVLRSDALAENCYCFRVKGSTGTVKELRIERIVNGVASVIAKTFLTSSVATWEKFRCRADEEQLSMEYWTGGAWVLLLTAFDTTHASGAVGLFGGSSSVTHWGNFDNVDISTKV